jgi:hypothetical protein
MDRARTAGNGTLSHGYLCVEELSPVDTQTPGKCEVSYDEYADLMLSPPFKGETVHPEAQIPRLVNAL